MKRHVSLIVLAILLANCAFTQSGTGTVSGTVRDQSGAVIPGAKVTITNVATNVSASTTSNEAGVYYFPGIIVGTYRLTVESPGMRKFEGGLTVQVAQSVVVDPVLQVGETTTSVEVKDLTPLVTVDSATIRNAIERARIEQLPINGRSITSILAACG